MTSTSAVPDLELKIQTPAITRVLRLPELAHVFQLYLEPRHLAIACLVCKAWHNTWTPFLWQTLTLTQPHPAFRSHLPRPSLSPAVSTTSPDSPPTSYPFEDERYVLSEECLGRHGQYVRGLNASWLTSQALLRLSTHCLYLQQVKLAETPIPNKVLRSMLTALVGLRTLKLDLPLEDFAEEEEDQTMHRTTSSSKESALMKVIEICASARLEHLELVFQTSIRIPVEALCSLLRAHPSLRTVKLMDADIVDSRLRVPSTKKKHKKKENIENRILSSLSASGSSSVASSVPNSASEDESESPFQPADSFGLHFLSITSSHTSDTTLRRILESCHNITALHLHSCDMITDSLLDDIVRLVPRLSSISLSSCKQLTSVGIDQFFVTHRRPFVHIHICALTGFHDGTLEILARRHGSALRKLAIYYCAFVTDKGIKALLMACSKLQVFGLQAYGMTPAIFEEPWACHQTLKQLDLQGVFKRAIENRAAGRGDSTGVDNVSMGDFSATRVWRDRQARIEAFGTTRLRLMTLSSLRNLRLSAGGIGKEVLEGFGLHQRIEILHLYGLQSTDVDKLPWTAIRTHYPFLKQVYCGVIGVMTNGIKDDLAQLNIELLTSSSIPDLAFENNFDDRTTSLW